MFVLFLMDFGGVLEIHIYIVSSRFAVKVEFVFVITILKMTSRGLQFGAFDWILSKNAVLI